MKSFKAQISPIAYLLGHPLELKQICKVQDKTKSVFLHQIASFLTSVRHVSLYMFHYEVGVSEMSRHLLLH